jgi:hypothetical protein
LNIINVIMTFLPNHNEFLTLSFFHDFEFSEVHYDQKARAQMSILSRNDGETCLFLKFQLL